MLQHSEESLTKLIMELLSKGHSTTEIEQILIAEGHEEFYLKKIMAECIKLRNARNRTIGLVLIVVGAVCCFTSFLLTINASSITESQWGLFGLTSLGVTMVFIGLMQIFM